MALFSRRSRRRVGVDIGTSSIKAVELSKKGSHLELLNYGVIDGLDFFGNISVSPNVPSTLKMSDGDIAVILKRLFKFSKIETKDVIFSIPIFSSFLTTMELPLMDLKELEKAVSFQAKSYIPVPLSEVVVDWLAIPPKSEDKTKEKEIKPIEKPGIKSNQLSLPTPPSPNKQPGIPPIAITTGMTGGLSVAKIKSPASARQGKKIQILLVAVQKEVIAKYQRIAQQANLNILAMEAESFSLLRSLTGNDLTTTMLVDFGARSTTLSLVDQGLVRMSHSVDLSGKEITNVIARGLNVSFSRAEELKKVFGLASKGVERGITKLITPLVDRLIVEFDKMSNIHMRKENRQIKRVILSGGSANLPGLTTYLSQKLGAETIVGDPFARVKYPEELGPVIKRELGTNLAVSVGLAMRDL